jgi:hypothetical protein
MVGSYLFQSAIFNIFISNIQAVEKTLIFWGQKVNKSAVWGMFEVSNAALMIERTLHAGLGIECSSHFATLRLKIYIFYFPEQKNGYDLDAQKWW